MSRTEGRRLPQFDGNRALRSASQKCCSVNVFSVSAPKFCRQHRTAKGDDIGLRRGVQPESPQNRYDRKISKDRAVAGRRAPASDTIR